MRATIYCRISRDREGAGLGVATQEADCRALAAEMGATVVSVRTDNDLSAYSGKPRPGYQELLSSVLAGEVDVVFAWHTDRLHRSPAELEDYITACEAHGVRTVTVKAGNLDLASPSGLVMARTLGAFARYEVDHARERMQRAKLRSAEAGKWKGGRRPFGFEEDGHTIRESEAVHLRDAADRILAGESVASIARAWNAADARTTTGREWGPSAPRRALLRPRNAGLMEHRGEVIGDAAWPAIIEPEKWRAVVGVLTDPSRRTHHGTTAVASLGSSLYLCDECKSRVRRDRDRQGELVYRCVEGSHVARRVADVDEFVSAVLVERLRRPDLAALLAGAAPKVNVGEFERKAVELTERKNQLASMFATGDIDAGQLSSGSRTLDVELTGVRDKIADYYSETALGELGASPDPGKAWLDAPLERQRVVLNALMTVTLLRSPRGRPAGWQPGESYFRPETISIKWRSDG